MFNSIFQRIMSNTNQETRDKLTFAGGAMAFFGLVIADNVIANKQKTQTQFAYRNASPEQRKAMKEAARRKANATQTYLLQYIAINARKELDIFQKIDKEEGINLEP